MLGPQTQEAVAFLEVYRKLQPARSELARKSELRLEILGKSIGRVFILEDTPEGFLFRLFDTRIVDLTGHDYTGQYLHEALTGDDSNHVSRIVRRCLDHRLGILSRDRLLYSDEDSIEVEILSTPWVDDQGKPRFVCGTFARLNGPGSAVGHNVRAQRVIEVIHDSAPRQEFSILAYRGV